MFVGATDAPDKMWRKISLLLSLSSPVCVQNKTKQKK